MIPYSKQHITEEDRHAVSQVLESDFVTQGPAVADFEDALKKRFSVAHAVVCSSGTAALHLSYAGAGVNPKTIGIVPAITFSATANAFRYLDAEVRFCDVDEKTGLICLDSLETILRKIEFTSNPCPAVVSPVSFAGATAPLDEVKNLTQSHGLRVIEDASHSPGSFVNGNQSALHSASCSHTDAACLSFHPVKHICCGEGGAVLTNDNLISDTARKLRSHGIERPYDGAHESPWFYQQTELGWNYRLTDFQAVLGKSQLSRLDIQLEARRRIAETYDRAFAEAPFKECFETPICSPGHSWHLYILRFKLPGIRDRAHKFLKERGILTQIHYVPLYKHPYYLERYGKQDFPGAEKFYQSCLSIPMFPTLSLGEQKLVIDALSLFCKDLL